MDPLSVSASIAALAAICLQTAKIIKKTIETIKATKDDLYDILRQVSQMQVVLRRLEGLTKVLDKDRSQYILDVFDLDHCRGTIEEMESIVGKIEIGSRSTTRERIQASVKWVKHKSDAGRLVERLKQDKLDIMGALQMVTA